MQEGSMRSTAVDVSTYIEEQPDGWQPALRKFRALCRRELKGYKEGMAYGMPSYARDRTAQIAFGSQARYLSFYVLNQPVLDAHRSELAGLSVGKGCIRYQTPDRIDWNVVTVLLRETAESRAPVC
jgi:uncharacterized protein YdhG (YjbR/CyaY superfamily)